MLKDTKLEDLLTTIQSTIHNNVQLPQQVPDTIVCAVLLDTLVGRMGDQQQQQPAYRRVDSAEFAFHLEATIDISACHSVV